MTERSPVTYKDSGVDIDAAISTTARIRDLARKTLTPGVLGEIGGFGGLFDASFKDMSEPVLVSSTDGVGTKLKAAFLTGRHNTVGGDLVNHCINDIGVQGARPLFFMDYVATGKLDPDVVVALVEGVTTACRAAGCALLGGETAEMPGFYNDGEYDIAGFIVGVVDRPRLITGQDIRIGDLLVGLPSVGLHTNGYSLARKLFLEVSGWTVDTVVPKLGVTVGEELLKPHLNYEPVLRTALEQDLVLGLAHITGGGITDNLPRILPAGCHARIRLGSWPVLPVFELMAAIGSIRSEEMLRATNMGVGMIAAVRPDSLDAFRAAVKSEQFVVGQIVDGEPGVTYIR
jgi:phosphoribosylformylglycinamidine cyclo-ligase